DTRRPPLGVAGEGRMNNRNSVLFAVGLALVALPGLGDSQRHQYIVMTKYLFVQPNASAPPPLATVVPKLGGHVDHSWNDRLVITLPDAAIDQVRQHAAVKYVQRVVTGPFTGHAQALSTSATSLRPSPTTTPPTWASGTYTYDNAGNITGIGNDTFIYDSLSRLKTANIQNKREDYEYDAYGNLTYKLTHDPDLPAGSQDRIVDLTARTDLATNRIGQEPYDPAGNDQGPNGTYLYDSFNMLRQKAPLGVPSYYVYTPDDQRIGSITCPSGPGDCWDQFWLISIRDVNGNVIRQYESPYYMPGTPSWPAAWKEDYVYRDGVLIGAERPAEEGGRRYFHVDHLGTPRLVTGAGAQRIAEHDYYPFGVEITPLAQETANGFDREDPLKFTGHERDLNSGTSPPNNTNYDDYLHARYRVPDWGRFSSPDPALGNLLQPGSWNRYAYVLNSPINFTDPYGLAKREPGQKMEPGDTCNGTVVDGWCTGETITVEAKDPWRQWWAHALAEWEAFRAAHANPTSALISQALQKPWVVSGIFP